MYTKLIFVFLGIILATQEKPLKPTKLIKAINCGLKEGTTKGDGDLKYDSDQALVSGSSVDVDYHSDSAASAADIKFTVEKQIYMFERHTYSSMTYSLPVRTGKHTLIFKFAQMYFEKPGQRVFNIKIGDKVVIENMDVIQKAGSKYAAHEEYLEFQVKNGQVIVNGQVIPSALKDRNIQVTFLKGKADNPIIQALILYQGPIQQTTKEDYENLKKNWGSHQQMLKAKKQNEKIKEMIAMTKKKQIIVIRNDQLLVQQEQQQVGEAPKREKFGLIRSFLMGPIGILIWTAVIAYGIFVLYSKVFLLSKQSNESENSKQN